MENYWIYLVYFGAGVLQDIVITIYYQLIAKKKGGTDGNFFFCYYAY